MMADQLFNDSSTVGTTAEIPDIFDVLEGGEDEGAVRYLLGFNGDEGGVSLLSQVETFGGMEVMDKYVGDGINLGLATTYLPAITGAAASVVSANAPVKTTVATIRHVHSTLNNKKRDTSGAKAIHSCDSCGKSFTTKFNLKRHINMHCHKSKENGIPIQGPPSASAPAKKNEKCILQKPIVEHHITALQTASSAKTENSHQITLSAGAGATSPPTVVHAPTILQGTVPYSRVVTVPQTEYQQQPDSTYKLPSVQTILPVSTTIPFSRSSPASLAAGVTTLSTITASCDSSQTTVSSVTSSMQVSTSSTSAPGTPSLPMEAFRIFFENNFTSGSRNTELLTFLTSFKYLMVCAWYCLM